MPPSNPTIRSTAGSWPFLLVSCGVVLGELLVRVLVGVLTLPVFAVVCPPLVTAAGVSVLVSLDGTESVDRSLAGIFLDFDASRWRTLTTRLAALAVVGHLLALGGGVAAFLLIDTPLRVVLYWLGYGSLLTFPAIAVSPIVGVALGAACAWAVPARAVPAIVSGQSLHSALSEAATGAFANPRRTCTNIAVHAGSVLCVGVVIAGSIGSLVTFRSPVVVGSVAAGVAFLVTTLSLSFLLALHLERERPSVRPSHTSTGRALDVRRVGTVLVLVIALSTGAAVVRTGDHRPVDSSPAALPSDADALYETALSNTARTDHRYRVAVRDDDGNGEPFVIEHRVDRTDRQYRILYRGEARGTEVYADSGTGSPKVRGFEIFSLGSRTVGDRSVRAVPSYFWWEARYELDEGALTPPAVDAEGWSVTERRSGEVTLELTTPLTVFEAGNRAEADRVESVTAARIRVVVDTENRTLSRATYRFEGTVIGEGGSRGHVDADVVYSFETGVDVERPDEVGSRSLGEWLWKVFAY